MKCIFRSFILITGLMLISGCATSQFSNDPDNIHQAGSILPENLRRVAVLPLAGQTDIEYVADGCDALSPIVFEELCRTKKVEAVQVRPETLRSYFGQASLTAEESLPRDFFASLKKLYQCDAVLFSELTLFHPYQPVAVGWRFKLVDIQTREIIWAADEIFDTAHPSAATSTKRGLREAIAGFYQTPKDDWTDSHSPNRVGRQSAALLLATLPERK